MSHTSEPKKAVILLSGGLDSTTALAIAKSRGFACYCLSFSYGQKQHIELEKSAQNATKYGAKEHLVLTLDLHKIGGSALTTNIQVPKQKELPEDLDDTQNKNGSIPVTYVPGRNSIFLTHAMAWAEVIGAYDIFIGVNALDYSGYPDCRPEFIEAFENLANLGTKAGAAQGHRFKIQAPLLHMTKKEIIQTGLTLGVDYSNTHSCYDPDNHGVPCGHCDACLLRLKGFAEAGIQDPVSYDVKK